MPDEHTLNQQTPSQQTPSQQTPSQQHSAGGSTDMPPLAVVFGGTGFIGRYLVAALAKEGWRVRVVSRRPARAKWLKNLGQPGQVELVHASLRDGPAVAATLQGATVAVNLVGLLFERGRQSFQAIHVQGAATIAQRARAAGLRRLVHISAIGADPSSPADYARTKAQGEAAVLAAFPDATILRPSLVIGMEDGFFNRFARMAQVSAVLPLVAGGHTRFQPLVVHDLVAAIVAALVAPGQANPAVQGRIFELGGPKVYSFKELLEMLLREMGARRLLLPLPMPIAKIQASFLQVLPNPPLTRDQLRLLRTDNVVTGDLPGLADLGIEARSIDTIVPSILAGYRSRRTC